MTLDYGNQDGDSGEIEVAQISRHGLDISPSFPFCFFGIFHVDLARP
jgi:hypothetical protein